MPVTFEAAAAETIEFIDRVMHRYHGPKHDLESTVQCLMVSPPVDENGDATGPALKHRGQKAYATIRQTKPAERALGHADIEIKISQPEWEEMSEDERTALIDHELEHLEPKIDKKTGSAQRDDHERPVFCGRDHDWEVGWFFSIARRHGIDSIECRQLRDFLDRIKTECPALFQVAKGVAPIREVA